MEAVFTSARFSLAASVSQGTLYLVLGFVGIHFSAASRCASTKFSNDEYENFVEKFCVLILNWIVLNRTDYLHKNGFGVK